MKIPFTVHSAVVTSVPVEIKRGGKSVQATMPGLVVELVHEDMSQTLRITDDVEEAQALFAPGAAIVATYEAGE